MLSSFLFGLYLQPLTPQDFHSCDLLIVLGTSLSVQPFASLVNRVPASCPRLLLNLESVGEVEPARTRFASTSAAEGFDFEGVTSRKEGIRDVRFLGTSDEGVRQLAKALGWEGELDEMMKRENASLDEAEVDPSAEAAVENEVGAEEKQEKVIEAVVEKVEKEMGEGRETKVDALVDAVEKVKLEEPTEDTSLSPPKATL